MHVAFLDDKKIKKIMTGNHFCLAFAEDGAIYAWGTNS